MATGLHRQLRMCPEGRYAMAVGRACAARAGIQIIIIVIANKRVELMGKRAHNLSGLRSNKVEGDYVDSS